MRNNPIEQGWQRFLDKLKELWGKLREPDPALNRANAARAGDPTPA